MTAMAVPRESGREAQLSGVGATRVCARESKKKSAGSHTSMAKEVNGLVADDVAAESQPRSRDCGSACVCGAGSP